MYFSRETLISGEEWEGKDGLSEKWAITGTNIVIQIGEVANLERKY